MTKILNFALKIKGVVGRVAKKIWNVHLFSFPCNSSSSLITVLFPSLIMLTFLYNCSPSLTTVHLPL